MAGSAFDADAQSAISERMEVQFHGAAFRCMRQGDGFAQLRWYKLIKKQVDGTATPEELLAQRELVYDMIVGWLAPDEYRDPTPDEEATGVTRPVLVHSELQRFQAHVAPLRLSIPDLLQFCWLATEAASGRPTTPPPASGSGQSTTGGGRTSNTRPAQRSATSGKSTAKQRRTG